MTVDRTAADQAAQQVAQRCAQLMWADDRASQALGMEIVAVGPGTATVSMKVREDMVNGHGIGHGGLTFTLADTAFAFACNTYNLRTVAQAAEIRFLAPTRLGDVLVARAVERTRQGRDGTYDIAVHSTAADGADTLVAEFVGHSKQIRGTFFDEEA
jgi:acyl-CoA thioesterase